MESRKNLIILSAFWSGIQAYFLNGDTNFKGMPAFTNTFLRLLDDKRVNIIYIIFFGNNIKTEYNIPKKYEHKVKVYGYSYTNKYSAFLSMLKIGIKILQAQNPFYIQPWSNKWPCGNYFKYFKNT